MAKKKKKKKFKTNKTTLRFFFWAEGCVDIVKTEPIAQTDFGTSEYDHYFPNDFTNLKCEDAILCESGNFICL